MTFLELLRRAVPFWGGGWVLALAACGGDGTSPSVGTQEQIAFVSTREGNADIYLVNADGTGLVNLTHHPASDGDPAWSPDGEKLVFVTDRGTGGLVVTNADGSGLVGIGVPSAQAPTWSPDGAKIAFAALTLPGGSSDIYSIDADPVGGLRRLTSTFSEYEPSWSADGATIAFQSNRDGNAEIYLMNADGSAQRNLTNNPAEDRPAARVVAGRDEAGVRVESRRQLRHLRDERWQQERHAPDQRPRRRHLPRLVLGRRATRVRLRPQRQP